MTTNPLPQSDPERLEILIVTPDQGLLDGLRPLFEERGRTVLSCRTSGEVAHLLARRSPAALIVDLVLPGEDGRRLVESLRSNPATAALPIVSVGPLPPENRPESELVKDADRYFAKPVNARDVVDGTLLLLKRRNERARKARRDALTGLLNRAALCEAYEDIAAECAAAQEPLALAIVGIRHTDGTTLEGDEAARNDRVRQAGAVLSACFRTTDIVSRWSLAEFAVILPGEDQTGAARALEKAVAALGRIPQPAPPAVPCRFHTGLAVVRGKAPLVEAVREAERQLFESYAAGLNGSPQPSADAARPAQRSERIAICVADAIMGRALSQILQRERFTVRVFASPDETLTALAAEPSHLLISDDVLEMKGNARLIERARALPGRRDLRAIMLVAGEAGIMRALELGANDYAIKPPDVASFVSRVRRMLAGGESSPVRTTVLVVDHEIPQLLVAGTALARHYGCRVVLAHGPADALQRLASVIPDYLILDLEMPGMTGQDLLAKLAGRKGIAVVPAAAANSRPAELESDTHRILERLTRPYKPDTLIREFARITNCPVKGAGAREAGQDTVESEIRRILTLRH